MAGLPRRSNLGEGIGAQDIDESVEDGGEDGPGPDVGEEGEEGEEQRRLVVDTTIIGRDIVVVKEEAFLD